MKNDLGIDIVCVEISFILSNRLELSIVRSCHSNSSSFLLDDHIVSKDDIGVVIDGGLKEELIPFVGGY